MVPTSTASSNSSSTRKQRSHDSHPSSRSQHLRAAIMAMLFWFGNLFYVAVLLVNGVAVLSEDRFLARSQYQHSKYLLSPKQARSIEQEP
ncbi:hypothetical protein TWF594_007844 [Orbilia oligospora]|nr:hypothetical protein TWF706_002550 [Orbilia oligospora]KAF3136581.1 hypothetical protein TWF594_007844 [Orbilia oligospora]